MRNIIELGNEYVKQSDWKDLALIKLCLCAMGVLLGLSAPKKLKRPIAFVAMALFITTYIPLICKLLRIILAGKPRK